MLYVPFHVSPLAKAVNVEYVGYNPSTMLFADYSCRNRACTVQAVTYLVDIRADTASEDAGR